MTDITGKTSGPESWDTKYEWKAVTLLTIGFGLVGLDRWVIAHLAGAQSSTMIVDLGLSAETAQASVGTMIAALGIAWGIAAFFMGNLSDRIGRKLVLVPALIMFSLLSGFSGLVGTVMMMIMMRALMGFAEGAYCPTSFAAVAEASKPSRRGFNLGLQQSAFALFGLAFAPIITTQLLQYMSWRWVFAIVGIPGLIVAVLVALTIREPRTILRPKQETAPTPKPKMAELFKHRNVPLSMVALLCAMCGIFVISAFTPSYMTSYLGLTDLQMGYVVSAIGFGGFVGQWWLCALSDVFGRKPMAITGFVIGAVFLAIFINTDGSNTLLLFGLLFVCAGFPFGLLSLITGPIATEAAPLGMIASTSGVIIGVGEVFGGGVAPVIAGGIAVGFGIQYTLYLALGGLIVGAVVSLFLRETAPRKVGSQQSSLDRLQAAGSSDATP